METNEQILFSNSFGSVTDKRIILNYKSGTEDLPIGQITSVSYQHCRNYVFVVGSFLICLGGLVTIFASIVRAGSGAVNVVIVLLVIVIVALLAGIANWIGHHNIQISAGGKDRKQLKAEMAKTREGREFVDAVKRAVIK
jgi:hypothetical protein